MFWLNYRAPRVQAPIPYQYPIPTPCPLKIGNTQPLPFYLYAVMKCTLQAHGRESAQL